MGKTTSPSSSPKTKPEEPIAPTCSAIKWKFEVQVMLKIGKETNRLISQKLFSVPEKSHLRRAKPEKEEHWSESLSTEMSEEEPQTPKKDQTSCNNLISQKLAEGDKKLKKLLKIFVDFEEIISTQLSPIRTSKFRQKLFSVLEKCLRAQDVYRRLNSKQLALMTLHLSTKEVEISQGNFLVTMNRLIGCSMRDMKKLLKASWFREIRRLCLA